jgi:hypothetical protein
MQTTGLEFSIQDLVECRIHRVTADFIKSFLIDELEGLCLSDIIAAKIHSMPPEYSVSFRQAGLENWRPGEISGFYHLRVPADYVKGMYEAGIVDEKEIMKAFKTGVKVEEVKLVMKNGDE